MIEVNKVPRIGIIIVTHQSARHIGALWKSLAETIDRQITTICVFDNASRDETVAVLERENVAAGLHLKLVCSNENVGFARANNEAFDLLRAVASPEVIILLNPDTVVHAGWWEGLVRALGDPVVGAAFPLLLLPNGAINSRGNALHFLGFGYVQGFGEDPVDARPDVHFFSGSGAALALSAQALSSMNHLFGESRIFWNELFLYAEDSDLGWRLRLAGLKQKLCVESRVTHDYHFPVARNLEVESRLFWIDRNRYLLLLANLRAATLCVLLPWLMVSEIALACGIWKLYPHRFHLARAVWKEISSPSFHARRRRIQRGRRVKDREILKAMTGSIIHGARSSSFLDHVLDICLRRSHRLIRALVFW